MPHDHPAACVVGVVGKLALSFALLIRYEICSVRRNRILMRTPERFFSFAIMISLARVPKGKNPRSETNQSQAKAGT